MTEKLITRVKRHATSQATQGATTLALTAECIEHMFGESGDWTPLAWLIGKSQAAQSRMVRVIAGKIVQGYKLRNDDNQPSGMRFAKEDGANTGIDEELMRKLKALIEQKKSIQSEAVKEVFAPKIVKVFEVEAYAKTVLKKLEKEGVSVADFERYLEAV